ncbi:hypothetical protein GH714_014362 [Hevea brasiliensis]|uniref:Uncharacterized protein n=1 Tax=Hevea brasiliensis TaxID=3981 RepID=A0A6A6KSY9_HEVBR|nr:hypothetical protein GH714_014362 [Hevea brasiliensis]
MVFFKPFTYKLVKHSILPRVHGLALKTTVAAVRVNALLCLGDLVQKLDKHAVLEILQTLQRCTAVDRSAPTLMCTLGVANSIFKQYRIIEEKRGVTVTDSGIPEVKTAPFPNGLQSQALSKTSGTVAPASKSIFRCNPQLRDADKQLNTGASSSSFDDLDRFANWPPRPSGTSSASGTSNNGSLGSMGNSYSTSLNASTPNSMNFQANGNNSWAFSSQSSSELLKSNQGISTMSASSLNSGHNPQNSIGFMKQNQGMSALGPYNDKKSTDLGSIFGSSKNEQLAPKLAPPPSTAVGRGRGIGRGATSTSRSTRAKQQSEQPSLLDLL